MPQIHLGNQQLPAKRVRLVLEVRGMCCFLYHTNLHVGFRQQQLYDTKKKKHPYKALSLTFDMLRDFARAHHPFCMGNS